MNECFHNNVIIIGHCWYIRHILLIEHLVLETTNLMQWYVCTLTNSGTTKLTSCFVSFKINRIPIEIRKAYIYRNSFSRQHQHRITYSNIISWDFNTNCIRAKHSVSRRWTFSWSNHKSWLSRYKWLEKHSPQRNHVRDKEIKLKGKYYSKEMPFITAKL